MADIGYVFESRPAGISEEVADRLRTAVDTWRAHHRGRRLVALPEGDTLRIVDERNPTPVQEVLRTPLAVAAFRATLKGRSAAGVTREVTAQGIPGTEDRVTGLLEEWRERRWLFHEDGRYVALPTGLGHE